MRFHPPASWRMRSGIPARRALTAYVCLKRCGWRLATPARLPRRRNIDFNQSGHIPAPLLSTQSMGDSDRRTLR